MVQLKGGLKRLSLGASISWGHSVLQTPALVLSSLRYRRSLGTLKLKLLSESTSSMYLYVKLNCLSKVLFYPFCLLP